MKRILTIQLILLMGFLGAKAQSEVTLPLMDNVFQSTYSNPAVQSEHKVSIGLPVVSSVYLQTIHSGFSPSRIIDRVNDTLTLFPSRIPGELRKHNMLHTGLNVDLFHLSLKIQNWNYWFGIRQNFDFTFSYPGDLFRFMIDGNAGDFFDANSGEFIVSSTESTFDFSRMGLSSSFYREYALGASVNLDPWVFGGRVNILQGHYNIHMRPNEFMVNVDGEMLDHTFIADGEINFAGFPTNEDGDIDFNALDGSEILSNLFHFRNPGLSIAGGASYNFDELLKIYASFRDLGFISWRDEVKNIQIDGTAELSGFDILSGFIDGDDEMQFDSLVFDIVNQFNADTTAFKYRTWLHPKFIVGAQYKVARRTTVGIQLYSVVNRSMYPAVTLSASQGIGNYLGVYLSGSYNYRTVSNLGLGLIVRPGPVQVYLVADNYFPLIDPLQLTNMNIRVGLNLVFGRVPRPVGLPYM